jgi:quercetin dioxygenase-like cupin family protein
VFVRVGDGETITARERRDVVILIGRDELTITWSRYAPGEQGPDLHVHREHTDAFYVLDGELTFAVGPEAERIRAGAGGFVAVPPNVAHSFANEASAEARWLNLHTPDKGFADYLRAARDGLGGGFDSFDPPADGGLPAAGVVVTGPGEGERLAGGALLRGVVPDLCVVEWTVDGPLDGHAADAYFVLEGELDVTVGGTARTAGPGALVSGRDITGSARVLSVHAPDGGVAERLRDA